MSTAQWIATRTLTDDKGDEVIVKIGVPERVDEHEWKCPLQIGETTKYAHGTDSMQALILAHEGTRVELEKLGPHSWVEPDFHGLPRLVPIFFGAAFTRKVEEMIDRELEAFGEAARKRLEARKQ
jgi:hypothetical protein